MGNDRGVVAHVGASTRVARSRRRGTGAGSAWQASRGFSALGVGAVGSHPSYTARLARVLRESEVSRAQMAGRLLAWFTRTAEREGLDGVYCRDSRGRTDA